MEKRKGVIEHLPACLLVSEVTLEAINDDKHLTISLEWFYFHLKQKLRRASQLRKLIFLHLFICLFIHHSVLPQISPNLVLPYIALCTETMALRKTTKVSVLWEFERIRYKQIIRTQGNFKCWEDGTMIVNGTKGMVILNQHLGKA